MKRISKVTMKIALASLLLTAFSWANSSGGGRFSVTERTRDQLPGKSVVGNRRISLDFNSAINPTFGPEIVIPDDATPAERLAAESYVSQLTAFLLRNGATVINRGAKTRSQNKRGLRGYFHAEPFFAQDEQSLQIIVENADEYVKILANTLGTIDGALFLAPHTDSDPGADSTKGSEREFARKFIIPRLQHLLVSDQNSKE